MTSLFRNEGPKLVEVDRGLEVLIFLIVEMTLSLLAEVVWMAKHMVSQTRQAGVLTISPCRFY